MNAAKAEYVERLTCWLMPDRDDPELAAQARKSSTLDAVYGGTSRRILRLVRLAYLRGVRRGAGCAWEARQPLSLRDAESPAGFETTPAEAAARCIADALAEQTLAGEVIAGLCKHYSLEALTHEQLDAGGAP